MTEKIGNVTLDYSRYPGEDFYCDGTIEDELLAIVQNHPAEAYPGIIREKRSWEVLYHLSDLRENIVEWLPMDKSMKVLEVGAGCGAITGSLARRAGSVTCVDLSKKRSLINAYRHREMDNITIHVGNFSDIEPDLPRDYDYICLIGVFEYGQSYIGGDHPFTDFYDIIKRHVKQGGRIAIAIENKMGLKYWAGCREDHLGTFFSGLEDYPEGGAVRTFTRGGLERILQECGEREYAFYYPYPDYKFMTMVYSDRYLPKVSELSNNLRNFDRDRMLLFDEKKVFDMVIREGLFPLYANSYMVVTGPGLETVYSRFSNDRAAQLCIRTDIGERTDRPGDGGPAEAEAGAGRPGDGSPAEAKPAVGRRYVRKYPANPAAAAHIEQLARNYQVFEARFAGSGLQVNRLERKEENGLPFVELEFLEQAITLEELLDGCLQREDKAGFCALFDRYLRLVSWNQEAGVQNYDLIFSNICVQGDVWTMIDYEWADETVTPEFVVRRALYCYVLENEDRRKNAILQEILQRMNIDEEMLASMAKQEREFQKRVMTGPDGPRIALAQMREIIGNKAVPCREYFARAERKKVQVFEDFGAGYSQANSWYSYDAYLADDEIRAQITCKKGLTGLRLDPAEVPCILRLRRISLDGKDLSAEEVKKAVCVNGELLIPEEKAGAGASRGTAVQEAGEGRLLGGSILFATSDPNINLRFDALGLAETEGICLVVEAEIAWLSQGMLRDLTAMKTRRKRFWFQK